MFVVLRARSDVLLICALSQICLYIDEYLLSNSFITGHFVAIISVEVNVVRRSES